jgi:crotonobetainyl-CoA:carnitine CoA-transferase CaiB-like acyl-CoA transferase
MKKKPLDGIRVIELSTFLAVPTCGRILGMLGADVIKIEPVEGEFFRIEAPIFDAGIPCINEENPIYLNANAGKRMIAIDLKTSEGMHIFHELIKSADIFITNIRSKALSKLGIAYEDLQKNYPKLVYGHVDGYGPKGAESSKPGFDSQAYLARGGFLLDLTEPGFEPNEQVLGSGDCPTGVALTTGILAALICSKRTGVGRYINSSLLNTAIWAGSMHLILAQYGIEFPRPRTHPPSCALATPYKCKDGEWIYFMVSQGVMEDWVTLCTALGMGDLSRDERYNSFEKQRAMAPEIVSIFDEVFIKKTYAQWDEILSNTGLCYDRVLHLLDVIQDPQAVANEYFIKREYPSGKTVYFATPPFKMSGIPQEDLEKTIHLGEHTREVLKEIGYSDLTIQELSKKSVIYAE